MSFDAKEFAKKSVEFAKKQAEDVHFAIDGFMIDHELVSVEANALLVLAVIGCINQKFGEKISVRLILKEMIEQP